MKVKISRTVEVTTEDREAIAHHFGLDGAASHETVRDFFENDFDLAGARKKWFAYQADQYAKRADEEDDESWA